MLCINQIPTFAIYKDSRTMNKRADFVIVGSGPVGSTFARKIREGLPDATIIMIDAGSQYSKLPGENAKNFYLYNWSEDGLDILSSMVKAELIPVSKVPANPFPEYLPPSSQTLTTCNYGKNRSNPHQDAKYAMPSAFSSFQVGGMAGHWTCCTPRPYKNERISSDIIPEAQFDELLDQSQKLYNTSQKVFEGSYRGQAVLQVVNEFFKEHKTLLDENRKPGMLPLAVERRPNEKIVHWTGADTILGEQLIKEWVTSEFKLSKDIKFQILAETLAQKLHFTEDQNGLKKIKTIQVKDLKTGTQYHIQGQTFIVCGNSFYTPQLLHESKIHPPALGKYLNEHSMMFCQVVLKNEIIKSIEQKKRNIDDGNQCRAAGYKSFCDCKDPFPILTEDPIPNAWIPHSQKFPFHVQLHRDAFPYSILPDNMGIDHRVILDIRFFAKTEARESNRIIFHDQWKKKIGQKDYYDLYGKPQMTIHFERSENDGKLIDLGMKYMQDIANRLGAYLKGVEPQVMPRGSSLHFMGTTRIGISDKDSTCNPDSLVWGTSNLYVGGNGNIPSQTACNPTLTSSALAIKAVRSILKNRANKQ